MRNINIITDKSQMSEHNAKLLASGIQAEDQNCNVEITDIAQTPQEISETEYCYFTFPSAHWEDDAFLFPTTGALSVFEKHFGDHLLSSKIKFGVLMTSKTTFDGPEDSGSHTQDNKLIERLAKEGGSHYPVVVERTANDQEITKAGRRFVKEIFCEQTST